MARKRLGVFFMLGLFVEAQMEVQKHEKCEFCITHLKISYLQDFQASLFLNQQPQSVSNIKKVGHLKETKKKAKNKT